MDNQLSINNVEITEGSTKVRIIERGEFFGKYGTFVKRRAGQARDWLSYGIAVQGLSPFFPKGHVSYFNEGDLEIVHDIPPAAPQQPLPPSTFIMTSQGWAPLC